jgi:type IV secretory pathway VirB10-like protein
MATPNISSIGRLSDEEVRSLVSWRKLPSLIRREVNPLTPSDLLPVASSVPGASNSVRMETAPEADDEPTRVASQPTAVDDAKRKRIEREAIAEIRALVRKSTKARDDETWFTRVNPLTDRKEVKWSTVLPLAIVSVVVLYGALRLYAAPGSQQRSRDAVQTDARRGSKDESARTEDSLFTPRSQYSVAGLEASVPPGLSAPEEPPPTNPVVKPSPAQKPAAPSSWQAGLTLAMPADVSEAVEEPFVEMDQEIALVEGTRIPAILVGTLASSFESPVQVQLDEDFRMDDRVLLPKGTVLLGVSQANATQRRIFVRFHRAILPSGEYLNVRGAAQNADFSTGLTADRVEKHRGRNVLAGAVAGIASRVGGLAGGPAADAAALARSAQTQAATEARGAVSDVTLYVTAGRRVFVYLEADAEL